MGKISSQYKSQLTQTNPVTLCIMHTVL